MWKAISFVRHACKAAGSFVAADALARLCAAPLIGVAHVRKSIARRIVVRVTGAKLCTAIILSTMGKLFVACALHSR